MFGTSVEYVRSILDINIPKFGLNSEIMRTNYMLSKKKCAEILYLKFVSLNSWHLLSGVVILHTGVMTAFWCCRSPRSGRNK